MSDLYTHYKGGKYRKLFEALVTTNPYNKNYDVLLLKALHSDNRREVMISIHPCGVVFVHDPQGKDRHCVVVYVSMTYGTVWVRYRDEFHGLVMRPPTAEEKSAQETPGVLVLDAVSMPRFREVEKFDVDP